MVRERGENGEQFALVNSQSVKNDDGEHIQGFREWKSDSRSLTFSIHKFKEMGA